MKNEIKPYISIATGTMAFMAVCTGYILQYVFPVPEGHHSAIFSAAGPIIFLSSIVSFFLGPVALVTGMSSIRKVSNGELPLKYKKISIAGAILGGAVSLLYLIGTVLVLVFVLMKGIK